jgi:hypothetical protein
VTPSESLLAVMNKHKDVPITVWIDVARIMGLRLKVELVGD